MKHALQCIVSGTAVVFCALFFLGSAYASNMTSNGLDEAVKSYKDRKYSQSLGQFKQLHDAGMCNSLIHYYMALNYQSLNQIAAAKQEYQTVARGSNNSLKQNAEVALASLDRWSQHRSYAGNGNVFARYGVGPGTSRYRPPVSSGRQIAMEPEIMSTGGG